MGTRKSYSEEIKWKTIELKKQGYTNKEIMDQLGIKNKAQIKIWMKWHREGETYRFSRPVGKQSTLQKTSEEGITEIEKLQIENRKLKMQIDILKKVPRNREELVKEVVVELVELMKNEYSIKEICILIGIPRSTYYRWKNKAKDIKEAKLEQAILTICMTNHFRYGHRKVTALLKRKYNYHLNRKTVQKIMQKKSLQCRVKRKRRTWINGESRIVVENLLNRNFQATKPNEKWVTDITYLPFGTEMLYLSSIMDLYNNEIIAYEISNRQDVTLVLKTVEKAIKSQQKAEIILHSDQGAVYTSYAFQALSKENGITTSMSRKGNCHDNAVIESFHSSLKSELFYSQEKQIHSTSTLKQLIHDYIEYYNTERIQEKLNYLSPIEYKKQVA
ncbi:IS3 family transposase [Bacillus cereus]|uniref:IS3 family transposase n=1 Tax=Bacillus cereus TaxID=1396 RepID=UPI000BF7DA5B|nr:IS3 family transposase [Bacillus cereus]PER88123.1 hypothetical protein CN500_31830 [Bacillus cereus]